MSRRLLIGVVLAVTALAVVATLIIVSLPADRLAAAAERRLESRLGREVRIGDVGLDILPALAVRLEAVEIGDRGRADEDDYAALEMLRLRPRLLPLLLRRVVVDEVEVERPNLVLHLDGAGIDSLFTGGGDGGGGRVRFAIDRVTVRDGQLFYRDALNGTELLGRGWQQELELEGEVREGSVSRVAATGSFSFDSLSLAMPGRLAYPVRDLRLSVRHDAELDRLRDRLLLRSLDAGVQELELAGSGTVTGLSDTGRRAIALDLETGDTDAAALFRSLPAALVARLVPGGAGAGVDGRARVVARVRGPMPPAGIPDIQGTLTLADLSVDRPALGRVVEAMGGVIAFSLDSVVARRLTGTALGGPARLSAVVPDLSAPIIRFEAAGTGELGRMGLGSDSLSLEGNARYDLQGTLPLETPERSDVRGTVELQSVRVSTPDMARPITADGRLRFDGSGITGEGLRADLPGGRATMALTVSDWTGPLLGDTTLLPSIHARIRATTLDLDALLGPPEGRYSQLLFARLADRRVQGRTAEEMADAMGLSLPSPPAARADLALSAERLMRGDLALEGLELDVSTDPDGIRVRRLDFSLMDGVIRAAARIQPAGGTAGGPAPLRLDLDYAVTDVNAGAFFGRFTPFRNHLGGSLRLVGTSAMTLDRHLLPERQSVTASGTMTLASGVLRDWDVLAATMDRLGLEQIDSIPLRTWSAEFDVAGPVIRLARGALAGGGLRALAEGSFDFGGRLDLAATLFLSRSLAVDAAPEIAGLLDRGIDEVPLGLRITGTTARPQIGLDLAAARDTALARARRPVLEEAERAASGAARRALGELFGGRREAPAAAAASDSVAPDSLPVAPLPRDSAGAATDSVRGQVEGLFRQGIRRLLPGRDTTP